MSDNPLAALPAYNRVSIRAVLVREGEDGSAALAEAGFLDSVVLPVIEGEDGKLDGGILGDGITPNLIAVLETEQTDDSDDSGEAGPGSAGSEADDAAPAVMGTTMLPSAYGMRPLAPVRTRK